MAVSRAGSAVNDDNEDGDGDDDDDGETRFEGYDSSSFRAFSYTVSLPSHKTSSSSILIAAAIVDPQREKGGGEGGTLLQNKLRWTSDRSTELGRCRCRLLLFRLAGRASH